MDAFDPDTRKAIDEGIAAAQQAIRDQESKMGEMVNGWQIARDLGRYGTKYTYRAAWTFFAVGGNLVEDAVYPLTLVDSDGKKLDGGNKYVLHLAKDQIPPVNAFWSLTLYDKDSYLVPNPVNRYALGDRSECKFGEDGSLTIYIQSESPGYGQGEQLAADAQARRVQAGPADVHPEGASCRRHLGALSRDPQPFASSEPASRLVKHDLIVPPEPLEQGAADIAWRVASNLADAAFPVDGIDEEFLPRIDRQVNIPVCMSPVDQDRRGPRRQPLLNGDRIRHSNGHVVKPRIAGKNSRVRAARAIVAADNDAVAHHGAAKQFGDRILLRRFERGDSRRVREPRHQPAMRAVRCLPDPAAERQPCAGDEVQKLRH